MKTAEIGSKEQRGLRTNTVYELNYNNYGKNAHPLVLAENS